MIKKFALLAFTSVTLFAYAQRTTHTVVKGDNPSSIARKYGMTLDELLKLNPSAKNGVLNIGDKIIVKGTAKPAAVSSNDNAMGVIIVEPKQTIYGLTKKYKTTETQLRAWNPNLGASVKIGERINIPMSRIKQYGGNTAPVETVTAQQQSQTASPSVSTNTYSNTGSSTDNFLTYTVESGDTTFGIVNKFGTTLDQLIALNPSVSSGLKPGMVLKIRKLDPAYVKKNASALNVVMMLPFGFESNDSRYRQMSLDFLAGAKLAVERNAKRGQELNIRVVDAGSEASFKNSITQLNQDNTDLIIGPFFKSNVVEVLDFVKEKQIPVVSPFANSEDLHRYGNLIIIETQEEVLADRIIQEIQKAYSKEKIYIIGDSSGQMATYFKAGLNKNLKNPNIIVVNSPSEIQLETNMMTGQSAPVITLLANSSSDIGEAFAEKMIELSQQAQGNKAFSMHYVPVFDEKIDELSQANLVYLTDLKINTEGSFEKEVLADFQKKYCKSPSKYAVVGFDVMNDMLTRENKSGEIFKQMNRSQTQLASKFEFKRAAGNGAYVNTGYRLIRY